MYYMDNLTVVYVMMVPVGIFGLTKGALTYLLMLEFVPSRLNGTLHTVGGICTSFICFAAIAFFYFVDNVRLFCPIMGIF